MAWSKNPLLYPKVFQVLLEAAEEGRDRVTFETQPGKAAKYKYQFYAFCQAWLAKAERERRLQRFEIAAQDEARAAKLGRYTPVVESARVTFINKDVLLEMEGVRVTVGERCVADNEDLDIVAHVQAVTERELLSGKEKKAQTPLLPIGSPLMPIESPEEESVALKLFGVDTSQRREFPQDIQQPTGDEDA